MPTFIVNIMFGAFNGINLSIDLCLSFFFYDFGSLFLHNKGGLGVRDHYHKTSYCYHTLNNYLGS